MEWRLLGDKSQIWAAKVSTIVVGVSTEYLGGVTFRFISTTNPTQILQARKQTKYDNNEH